LRIVNTLDRRPVLMIPEIRRLVGADWVLRGRHTWPSVARASSSIAPRGIHRRDRVRRSPIGNWTREVVSRPFYYRPLSGCARNSWWILFPQWGRAGYVTSFHHKERARGALAEARFNHTLHSDLPGVVAGKQSFLTEWPALGADVCAATSPKDSSAAGIPPVIPDPRTGETPARRPASCLA